MIGSLGLGRTVTICRSVLAQAPILALGSLALVGAVPLAVTMVIGISTAIRLMLYPANPSTAAGAAAPPPVSALPESTGAGVRKFSVSKVAALSK